MQVLDGSIINLVIVTWKIYAGKLMRFFPVNRLLETNDSQWNINSLVLLAKQENWNLTKNTKLWGKMFASGSTSCILDVLQGHLSLYNHEFDPKLFCSMTLIKNIHELRRAFSEPMRFACCLPPADEQILSK